MKGEMRARGLFLGQTEFTYTNDHSHTMGNKTRLRIRASVGCSIVQSKMKISPLKQVSIAVNVSG